MNVKGVRRDGYGWGKAGWDGGSGKEGVRDCGWGKGVRVNVAGCGWASSEQRVEGGWEHDCGMLVGEVVRGVGGGRVQVKEEVSLRLLESLPLHLLRHL